MLPSSTVNCAWSIAALALACFAPVAAAQVSSGTAFAVAPGLLVTNQHVVAGCGSVEVVTAEGRRNGSIVDADSHIDLALLRVAGIKGATARLRKPRNIRLGESVMVFGFPLTGSLSSGGNFTSGLVSALSGYRDAAGKIQITAPVQPGNSGGPLMDASGLVIGVVQAKLDALRAAIVTGDIPQNVNFAIALDVLADFLAKNRITFRDGAPSAPLDTAQVADLAQSFTYRVECRGVSRQAAAPPSVKPRALPSCPLGAFNSAKWTNCVGEATYGIDGNRILGVGTFEDGKFHELEGVNSVVGEKYVGEFRDGKQHGQGTYTWLNGQKYVGEFRDSKRNGRGTLYHSNGAVLRSGTWVNDVFVSGR